MTYARRHRLLAIAALATAAGPACAGNGADRPEPVTVRFGVIQAVDMLPVFVMQEEGYAAARGVRVDERTVTGGPAALAAMAAGSLDVAYTGSLPTLAAARAGTVPADVVAVGVNSVASEAHPGIAVLAGPGVRRWSDLAGTKVAVNQVGSIGDIALRIHLAALGVTGVEYVEIGFPNQGLAVTGGNVAAAVMIEPFVTQSRQRGDGEVLGWVIGGPPFPDFIQSFVAVRRGFAERGGGRVVEAFLAAHVEAVRWIEEHPDRARALAVRRLGLPPGIGAQMTTVGFAPGAALDARRLASMQATLAASDAVFTPVAVESFYDPSFLARATRS